MSKTLYIDGLDFHEEDKECLVLHPSHLTSLNVLDDNYFDECIIKNSPAEYLKAIGLFHIFRALKKGGVLQIIVDQPIYVMQSIDASQIESSCRLAGFNDIREESYSSYEKKNGKESKIETSKLTMVKP
jgi:hypothetical protein